MRKIIICYKKSLKYIKSNKVLFLIGAIMFVPILLFMCIPPFNDWSCNTDPQLFAQYGDFIGGLVGSLLTGATILLLIHYNNKQLDLLKNEIDKSDIQHKEQLQKLNDELLNNQNQFNLSQLKQDYFYYFKDFREFLLKYNQPKYFHKEISTKEPFAKGFPVRTTESSPNQNISFLEDNLYKKIFEISEDDKVLGKLEELKLFFSDEHKHFVYSFIKKINNIENILKRIKDIDENDIYFEQFLKSFQPEEILFIFILGNIGDVDIRYQNFINTYKTKLNAIEELKYYDKYNELIFRFNINN